MFGSEQIQTSVAVRTFAGDDSALFLSAVPLFGSTSLFGLLCYIRRTCAASFHPLPFVLLFVLFGFLFEFFIAGQRRAGDDGGGNCERGTRGRAGGGSGSRNGSEVSVTFLQAPG